MAKHKRNTSGLKPYTKGQSGNPNGRPKKLLSKMPHGYTKIDLENTLKNLFALNIAELKSVVSNQNDSTLLEMVVAKAIASDISEGKLTNTSILFARAFGMPKQEIENNAKVQMIKTDGLTNEQLELLAAALPLPNDNEDNEQPE